MNCVLCCAFHALQNFIYERVLIMPKTMISVSNVTKKFGQRTVLSDVNLKIKRGDSIAFIGHNGSGKSTLLKIIAGLLPFDNGKVLYSHKLKFDYVPERFPTMNITAREYVIQMGLVEGLSRAFVANRSQQLFEALFMNEMADTPIRYLSKWTIQKVAVVQAFLSPPDVLLLDEPISGQDSASQRVFMDMVNQLNYEHDVTILCSCHEDYMVAKISKSVYEIIDHELHEVKDINKFSNKKICLRFENKTNELNNISQFVIKSAMKIEHKGNEIEIHVATDKINSVIREMLNNNF